MVELRLLFPKMKENMPTTRRTTTDHDVDEAAALFASFRSHLNFFPHKKEEEPQRYKGSVRQNEKEARVHLQLTLWYKPSIILYGGPFIFIWSLINTNDLQARFSSFPSCQVFLPNLPAKSSCQIFLQNLPTKPSCNIFPQRRLSFS